MPQRVIEVKGCSFAYRKELILDGVDFWVEHGQFVCVIGSNGAGKSTLLRLLLGELHPLGGSIRLFGQPVERFHDWPRIGYVPQNAGAGAAGFPATVREVVSTGLYTGAGRLPFAGAAQRERVRRALEVVGMERWERRRIGELSGGQLQRVLVARALVGGPDMLLLDEPTTGVDADACEALYALLHRLNTGQGLSIVMVTHDTVRAARYLTACFCLEDGSLLELDRAQIAHELEHRHTHPPREKGEDAGDR